MSNWVGHCGHNTWFFFGRKKLGHIRLVIVHYILHNIKIKIKIMAELKKCATCGCSCGGGEEDKTVEAPTPEDVTSVEGASEEGQEQIKSFRLHRHSNDTEFAVLLALVPAMTMTLFNLMGLL